MESIIKDNIQKHLQNNNVIPLEQHGFTPGRSCSTQLLGIQIDSHLKFHEHTTVVTKKANRLLSIIHKVFHYFDKGTEFINLIVTANCRQL